LKIFSFGVTGFSFGVSHKIIAGGGSLIKLLEGKSIFVCFLSSYFKSCLLKVIGFSSILISSFCFGDFSSFASV